MNVSTSASVLARICRSLLRPPARPPGRQRVQRDAKIAEDFAAVLVDVVEEQHEAVVTLPSASRIALTKFTLLRPSVARSSTSSTRWPGSNCPSICAPRPKPFGFLRTYCIGRCSRSATHAAKGMPAVSPPATVSILSRPISRSMPATHELHQRRAHIAETTSASASRCRPGSPSRS